MYLASATRPDIAFAVSKLGRFVSNLGDDHWHALERVMRYLKGTTSYGIHYTWYPRVLEGYSDSNWISDANEIKATSGYVFTGEGHQVFGERTRATADSDDDYFSDDDFFPDVGNLSINDMDDNSTSGSIPTAPYVIYS